MTQMHFTRCLLCLLAANWCTALSAASVTIDSDTVIGTGAAPSEDSVTVTDGAEGPATLRVTDGGYVGSYEVTENSQLIVDGGRLTSVGDVMDNAHLLLLSGTVACEECELDDVPYLVGLYDDAALAVKGGILESSLISLNDQSTATFVGRNLSLRMEGTGLYSLSGTLADGTPLQVSIEVMGDAEGRITLQQVPEPCSVALLAVTLLLTPLFATRR